jgi:hypothetical protein
MRAQNRFHGGSFMPTFSVRARTCRSWRSLI